MDGFGIDWTKSARGSLLSRGCSSRLPSPAAPIGCSAQSAWARLKLCWSRPITSWFRATSCGLLPPMYPTLWKAFERSGATGVGLEAVENLRVLEGIPLYGVDLNDRDLPQETNQTRALNFNKGCYLGQEIVERIRSRGKVHRLFRQFSLDGLAAGAALRPRVSQSSFHRSKSRRSRFRRSGHRPNHQRHFPVDPRAAGRIRARLCPGRDRRRQGPDPLRRRNRDSARRATSPPRLKTGLIRLRLTKHIAEVCDANVEAKHSRERLGETYA